MNTCLRVFLVYSILSIFSFVSLANKNASDSINIISYLKKIESSLVVVTTVKQPKNAAQPWENQSVRVENHLGIVVKPNNEELAILTPAYAAVDRAQIYVKTFHQKTRKPAKVYHVDYELNLALIKPVDMNTIAQLVPLELGNEISLGKNTKIISAPNKDKLLVSEGQIVGIEMLQSITSSFLYPHYAIKVQERGLGWGEPLFDEKNQLIGLIVNSATNSSYGIPIKIIASFLNQDHKKTYKKPGALGISYHPLKLSALRSYIGDNKPNGVRVSSVLPASSLHNKLFVDDVLYKIDGYLIDNQGFVNHPQWGDVSFLAVLAGKLANDTVKLEFRRKGKELSVDAPLMGYRSNSAPIIEYYLNRNIPYTIFAGFVFQELSLPFLTSEGSNWLFSAQSDFLYYAKYKNEPGQAKRFLIINKVLSDEINLGYHTIKRVFIDEVNNMKVTSLTSLNQALNHPLVKDKHQFARIVLSNGFGEIIVSYDDLKLAHQRISLIYGIADESSFFKITK